LLLFPNRSNEQDFVLMRFNLDGTLDTTFGNSGQVVTDFNPPNGYPLNPAGEVYPRDYLMDVAIQNDGKVLAGGYTSANTNSQYNFDFDFALVQGG